MTSSLLACSTSSPAPAARSARRWPPTRGSPRSPSPARPSPAGSSAARGGEHHPLHHRVGRQVAQRLLRRRHGRRRRIPGQGGRRPGPLRLQQGRGLHLPLPGPDPRVDLRPVHGALPRADRPDPPGQPAGSLHPDGPAELQGAARQDRRVRPHRPGRGRRVPHRRQAAQARRGAGQRLLLRADGAEGPRQDAGLPGGDLGPVLAVTTFKDEAEAIEIANDTLYGFGAGVWTRNGKLAYEMGRAIQAGRVWTNCYHVYPAGASFGGYKMWVRGASCTRRR